ncbi:MAG: WG repeat-containing protein [Bacteroidales bacterium]|nr:WG repeat-containing protein [Bacteroidales bacterium]
MKKIIVAAIMAVMAAFAAEAQEAVVKKFEAVPIDLTAQKYARADLHGVRCAVVKVQVIAPGVTFQGNVVGDVVEKPGEYWVYMSKGTRMLKVMSRTFKPLMVDFPEPLASGMTYVLNLDAPQGAGADGGAMEQQGFLVMTVSPSTARVYVDGSERAVRDGRVRLPLRNGKHTFRVEAMGYAPEEGSVTMAGAKVERTVTLRSVMPRLTVVAADSATEIVINDETCGRGTWSGELPAGDYVVEGRKPSHRPAAVTVTLAEGASPRTLTLPALQAITGALSIAYEPDDAAITVDGAPVGTTPNILNNVLVGAHTVVISKDDYEPVTLNATVTESATTSLEGKLNNIISLTKKYYSFQDEKTGKWGYKCRRQVVIPAIYDETSCDCFSEGLAAVKLNDKYGYIDWKGTIVIPAVYEDANNFVNNMALVKLNGKMGCIDRSGNIIIPLLYDYFSDFSEGLAVVRAGDKCSFIDVNGKKVFPIDFDGANGFYKGRARVTYKGKEGIIDKTGAFIVPAKYRYIERFEEGKAGVRLNDKWGFIDENGKEIIPAIYDYVTSFSNGMAAVELNGKWGYIDSAGNLAVPAIYDNSNLFGKTAGVVWLNNKFGAVDRTGKIIVPVEYDYVHEQDNGAYFRVEQNGKVGMYDKSGRLVIPVVYDDLLINDGMALMKQNDKWGVIDFTGKVLIQPQFDDAYCGDGMATVGKDNKWGFVDKTGNVVVPLKYQAAGSFSESLAAVVINGKCGYIDKTDRMIIPAIYDRAWSFSEGLAAVTTNGKTGFIDKTGKMVIPALYDAIDDFGYPFESYTFVDGEAVVGEEGVWVTIDRHGNELSRYNEPGGVSPGLSPAVEP